MTTLQERKQLALEPPSALARVRYLRGDIGMTEGELADATGATTRTVRRWTKVDEADLQRGPNYAKEIDDLYAVVSELCESLTGKGIRQWLKARNRYLKGERPIDLLRKGQFQEVYDAAVAFRDGVYL